VAPAAAASATTVAPAAVVMPAAGFVSPHGPYSTTSDQCAACHRAHTAKSSALLATAGPQSTLCFTCHDGTGATLNVATQYSDPKVPANDPTTASFYTHDVTTPTAHILASSDEFSGVFNRHTECSDCHNPHQGSLAVSTSSPDGTPWTPGGPNTGTSGLSVVNGPGTQAYTFLDGVKQPITAEYQLCLKCHSGSTVLRPKDPAFPSRDSLDAGAEFNPGAISFHPVEAAGKNTSPKMALSLSGASPYKLWTFTTSSTVRCTNCHANGLATGATPAAGDDLAPHASANRGILLRNYRDRDLKPKNEAYADADFALCYLCHTNSPFSTQSTTATDFSEHYKHLHEIPDKGSGGRSIDTAGGGQGNALCSECHFRTHSTATTTGQYTRLVSFAPDVQAVNGVLSWTSTGTGRGTCTLRCHGETHNAMPYN
jgi:predicted CXXCH cytochrome family protein